MEFFSELQMSWCVSRHGKGWIMHWYIVLDVGLRTVPYYGYGHMSLRVKTGSVVPSPVLYIDLSNLKRDGMGHFMGVLRVMAVFKYSNYTNMLRLCLQRTNIYSNSGDNHPATTPLPRNMYETMWWSLPLITPAFGHPMIQRCYVFRSGRFCVMSEKKKIGKNVISSFSSPL